MVIGMISILLTMSVLAYIQYIEKVRENICKKNCWNLERLYEAELVMQNAQHSEVRFKAFLMEHQECIVPMRAA